MAYIRVDHSRLEATASEIDAYVSLMKKRMGTAKGAVSQMLQNWQGADAVQFHNKWQTVTNAESTYTGMIKALESYAKYLRYAANKYKEAQAKAVNSANRLPK